MKLDHTDNNRSIYFIAAFLCAALGSTLVALSLLYPRETTDVEEFILTSAVGANRGRDRSANVGAGTNASGSGDVIPSINGRELEPLVRFLETEISRKSQQRDSLAASLRSQERAIVNHRVSVQKITEEVEASELKFTEAAARATQLRTRLSGKISDEVEQQMQLRTAAIRAARDHRDKLRGEEGALPDRQSEAQFEQMRIRQERELTEKKVRAIHEKSVADVESEAIALADEYARGVLRLRSVEQELNDALKGVQKIRIDLEALKIDLEDLRRQLNKSI